MSLSLSATLDLAVWSTSLEAGVVIVPFERLRTWACVYVFGLSFFNVGLKDVTTQSAIMRLVSTVTDTPLLFTHCMSFLAFVVYEELLCFPLSFLHSFSWTAIFLHLLFFLTA